MKEEDKNIHFRVNDVWQFNYNEEYLSKHKDWYDPYHCFDGQLIVKQKEDGQIYLEDTYWNSGDNRIFTPKEAIKQGNLVFKCNLDDTVQSSYSDYRYYNEEDIIDVSTQHHSYVRYRRKKDAKRSKRKMLDYTEREIDSLIRDIEHCQHNISRYKELQEEIETTDNLDAIILI